MRLTFRRTRPGVRHLHCGGIYILFIAGHKTNILGGIMGYGSHRKKFVERDQDCSGGKLQTFTFFQRLLEA